MILHSVTWAYINRSFNLAKESVVAALTCGASGKIALQSLLKIVLEEEK